MASPPAGVGVQPSNIITSIRNDLVTREPSSLLTTSPDESFIAERYSFGLHNHHLTIPTPKTVTEARPLRRFR